MKRTVSPDTIIVYFTEEDTKKWDLTSYHPDRHEVSGNSGHITYNKAYQVVATSDNLTSSPGWKDFIEYCRVFAQTGIPIDE